LLVLTELLEARIVAQRIPQRVELQIRYIQTGRDFEKVGQGGDGGIRIAEARLNLCQYDLGLGLVHRIVLVVFDRALRLLERLFLFSKPRIS